MHKSIVKAMYNGNKKKLSTWHMAALTVILTIGQGLGARAPCLECFCAKFQLCEPLPLGNISLPQFL